MKESGYWRSLEELANSKEFQLYADDEFPNRTPDWNDASARRTFLQVMGASLALAGASACTRQPAELIVPYVRQPEQVIPGKPMFYATARTVGGIATGVLVESHLGRPTKIEGNPDHPASLGATDAATQASILTLYDPDRSQTVLHDGAINSYPGFIDALAKERDSAQPQHGRGIRILTGTVTSPTLDAQIREFLSLNPEARWHQYEPCGRHSAQVGSLAAFGQPWNTIYDFTKASVIVSLDADFLSSSMPGHLRYARDYAGRRRKGADGSAPPPRMYVAESSPSLAGGMAEHRLRMKAAAVAQFAANIAARTGQMESAIARDLDANRGAGIVIAGEHQPASVHAIAHALNREYGNAGQTVLYTDPVEARPEDQIQSLRQLVADMNAGAVRAVIILGGNPVYDAPADFGFADAMARVPFRVHLGLYADETAQKCMWHVPGVHYLETWSDARAYDGTASIVQPLIMPLYSGRSVHEIVAVLSNKSGSAHDIVREHWQSGRAPETFDDFWQTSLHNGVVAGTALAAKMPPMPKMPAEPAAVSSALEIVFRPDPAVGDGTLSNNAWLQEMPKPQSKMTWDNAVWISPASAKYYTLENGDVVEIEYRGRKVTGPVWIMAGHADESVTVHFGYGRTRAGRVANGVGFDAYKLRAADSPWNGDGVKLTPKSRGYTFAQTQHTQTMEERDPFHMGTYADLPEREPQETISLFPQWNDGQHKWGMAIDLNSCIGCQACTIACQSENNIPVVGKDEVAKGRHMNWLRVDRYFRGSLEDPQVLFQPVPCMHCENAPCELVCPVAATVHSGEGLNEMVYNRCVGTRYCSNNCPYKVRRFNFFLYADWNTESLYGGRNPDVSVRSRGVMEKCSYCVQRINEHKIEAEKEDRPLRDGEIVTACQQSCPAQAIIFGDLNDPNSAVNRWKAQSRNYRLLEELNTRPRTTYLARLRNPNSDLEQPPRA